MDKVKQFIEKCPGVNETVAKYYLELSNEDVEKAHRMLLEDSAADTSEDESQNQILVLEWNIQGLLDDCLSPRIQAVVDIIKSHQPDVVMLQEVIMQTYQYMRSVLSPNYKSFAPFELSSRCASYFTAIFINTSKLSPSNASIVPFPGSTQARQLLIVYAKCKNRELVLMTSHLESTKDAAEERKSQLATTFNSIMRIKPNCTVIFGGDTNLRDYEFNSVVASSRFDVEVVNDVWSMLGSPHDSRFSWDLQNNDNQIQDGKARLRFERMYTRVEDQSNKNVYKPKEMKFVGMDRLPCGMFPSDHWGILASFSV